MNTGDLVHFMYKSWPYSLCPFGAHNCFATTYGCDTDVTTRSVARINTTTRKAWRKGDPGECGQNFEDATCLCPQPSDTIIPYSVDDESNGFFYEVLNRIPNILNTSCGFVE